MLRVNTSPKILAGLVLLVFPTQLTFGQQSEIPGPLLDIAHGTNSVALESFGNYGCAGIGGIPISGSYVSFCPANANGHMGRGGETSVRGRHVRFESGGTAEGSGCCRAHHRPWRLLCSLVERNTWLGVLRKLSLLAVNGVFPSPTGASSPLGVIVIKKGYGFSARLIPMPTATNSAVLAIGTEANIGGILVSNSEFSGTATSTSALGNSVVLGSIGSGATIRIGGIVIK